MGASTRAAAFSALRAGLTPLCIDRFADRDLAAVCTVRAVAPEDYPAQLASIASRVPPSPWLYTGALENEPGLVASLSVKRDLWGNNAETLRRVRDPISLRTLFQNEGIVAPAVVLDSAGLPRDGHWFAKPLRSGGGEGVAPLDGHWAGTPEMSYFQERISGSSCAAIFLATETENELIGVTRQWVGRPGAPFAYAGSLGPLRLEADVKNQLIRIRAGRGWRASWWVGQI